MSEDFEFHEPHSTFDFKGFLFKLLQYWPLFLASLLIALGIAYYINVRKLPIYQMGNMISIKDDQNPFFTSNTSLTFNWGGTTDKVNTAVIALKSRSHNEKVVQQLQYFLDYKKEGKYQLEDAYKQTPFIVEVDIAKPQMVGKQLKVVFKDSVTFELSTVFEEGNVSLQNYGTKEIFPFIPKTDEFKEEYKIGQKISTPFFNATFVPNPEIDVVPGIPFYLEFLNFDGIVKRYLNIRVEPETSGSSVLTLSLTGNNKARLVDYLNTSVSILGENMLERKNLFATKTIRFIDSSLAEKSTELINVENELNQFKNKNAIFNLETEGAEINARLNTLDLQKEAVNQELKYYNILENYLNSHTDYRDVPAPSVAGITEASVVSGVGRIVELAQERNKLQYSFKDGAPVFADIDRQINAVKTVLLENLRSSKILKNQELNFINQNIGGYEGDIRKLPKEQQELLKIERRYNLSDASYNLFLAKRSEAGLVKAANVSDVLIIDSAKDTGGGQVGPNTQLNYVLATFFGLMIPFLFVFLKVFFDTKISSVKDLERTTKIPILGVLGKSNMDHNLAVISKPKSAIAEGFRALRSSLQFIYKKQGVKGSKTVLVTSSVSGEGKTFCSINLASVIALSEKKTILVGLDLRRPKIFNDFSLNNNIGVVNYLINDAQLNEIIQPTGIPNFDVISSGPIPPNPSELLIGERMEELMEELKNSYDYIILDSPPLGLVSDSLELMKYVDATIYLVRHNYTHKNMFTFVNEKYKTGEVKHISLVLNDYEEKIGRGYGYGYGYGYGNYGNGYHENAKKSTILEKLKRVVKKW